MEEYKITNSELESGVVAAPDTLTDTPQNNKLVFDRLPKLIAQKLNAFIEAVIAKFTDYYTKTEVDGKEKALNTAVGTKANDVDVYKKTETYTKSETDEAISQKVLAIGAGDMAKDVYDTNFNGVVDDAEKLGGELPEYYATKTEAETAQTTANNAVTAAQNAQSVADAAMPKSGGNFTDMVRYYGGTSSFNYSNYCFRNIGVTNSSGTTVATVSIKMVRK